MRPWAKKLPTQRGTGVLYIHPAESQSRIEGLLWQKNKPTRTLAASGYSVPDRAVAPPLRVHGERDQPFMETPESVLHGPHHGRTLLISLEAGVEYVGDRLGRTLGSTPAVSLRRPASRKISPWLKPWSEAVGSGLVFFVAFRAWGSRAQSSKPGGASRSGSSTPPPYWPELTGRAIRDGEIRSSRAQMPQR